MKRIEKYLLPLILLLATALRLVNLNQSFWLDEAAQVIESARPLSQQLDIAGDFQPPLFHLLLHFWMYFGKSEIWIRLLPVLISIGTVYVSYLFGNRIKNLRFGLLLSFFVAIAPFHIWYSQEVRPYALSALLGISATYLLFEKKFFWYFIAAALFLYTIYLAPFLIFAHGVWMFLYQRKLFQKFLISVVGVVAMFLPWVPFFAKQLQIGTNLTSTLPGWSQAVSLPVLKSLPLTFTKFIIGRITIDQKLLYATLVSFLFLGFLYLFFQTFKKEKNKTVQLSILFLTPIFISFIVSFFIPILAPQRVLFTLPFFYALLGLGILVLSKRLRWISIGVIVVVSFTSLFVYYTNPRFQREQWRQAVSYVELNAKKESLVVFVFPDTFAPWQWYTKGTVDAVGVASEFILREKDLEQFSPMIVSRDQVFLFQYLTELTDRETKMKQFLENSGFVEKQVKDFPGVGFIYIYEKFIAQH